MPTPTPKPRQFPSVLRAAASIRSQVHPCVIPDDCDLAAIISRETRLAELVDAAEQLRWAYTQPSSIERRAECWFILSQAIERSAG